MRNHAIIFALLVGAAYLTLTINHMQGVVTITSMGYTFKYSIIRVVIGLIFIGICISLIQNFSQLLPRWHKQHQLSKASRSLEYFEQIILAICNNGEWPSKHHGNETLSTLLLSCNTLWQHHTQMSHQTPQALPKMVRAICGIISKQTIAPDSSHPKLHLMTLQTAQSPEDYVLALSDLIEQQNLNGLIKLYEKPLMDWLTSAFEHMPYDQAAKLWPKIGKYAQKHPPVILAFLRTMLAHINPIEVSSQIHWCLKKLKKPVNLASFASICPEQYTVEAIQVYKKHLKMNPESYYLQLGLARLFLANQQLSQSLRTYQNIESWCRSQPNLTIELAKIYLKNGYVDQALKLL